MVEANITSFVGSDENAIHYYCKWNHVENDKPNKYCSLKYVRNIDLSRILDTQSEVDRLNRKDRCPYNKLGDETYRFNSISEIHETLIKMFPNENITTYFQRSTFEDMLCIFNGVNIGYEGLNNLTK